MHCVHCDVFPSTAVEGSARTNAPLPLWISRYGRYYTIFSCNETFCHPPREVRARRAHYKLKGPSAKMASGIQVVLHCMY